jgi:hypothetical protein
MSTMGLRRAAVSSQPGLAVATGRAEISRTELEKAGMKSHPSTSHPPSITIPCIKTERRKIASVGLPSSTKTQLALLWKSFLKRGVNADPYLRDCQFLLDCKLMRGRTIRKPGPRGKKKQRMVP